MNTRETHVVERTPARDRRGLSQSPHMIRYSWEQHYKIADPKPEMVKHIEQSLRGNILYQSPIGFDLLPGTPLIVTCQVIWFDYQIAPKKQIEFRVEFWLLDPSLERKSRIV